jgi:hypothetical protein
MWDNATVKADLIARRNGTPLPPETVKVVNSWIESMVSLKGRDLDRDDAIQHLWVSFLDEILPKLEFKEGWHTGVLWLLERRIIDLRQYGQRRKMEPLNDQQDAAG